MSTNESPPNLAGVRRFGVGAILIGGAILAISFLPAFSAGRERWSNEKAVEYQNASLEIQRLTHEAAALTPDNASREKTVEFRKAIENFDTLRSELEAARSAHGTWAAVLRILGGAAIAVGVLCVALTLRPPQREHGVHLRREPSDAAEGDKTA